MDHLAQRIKNALIEAGFVLVDTAIEGIPMLKLPYNVTKAAVKGATKPVKETDERIKRVSAMIDEITHDSAMPLYLTGLLIPFYDSTHINDIVEVYKYFEEYKDSNVLEYEFVIDSTSYFEIYEKKYLLIDFSDYDSLEYYNSDIMNQVLEFCREAGLSVIKGERKSIPFSRVYLF